MLEKICDSSGMGGSPATVCFTLALVGMAGCFTEGINCDCGDGASFRRGECVADLTCGPGTTLQDGECLLGSDGVVCDGQLEVSEDGRRCVPGDGACEPPAILDQMSGRCVSPGEIVCGIGTEPNGNLCVPSCDGDFEISNAQRTGCEPAARIQFVHASADPSITSVNVLSSGNVLSDSEGLEVGSEVAFREATPIVKVSIGRGFPIGVVAADAPAQSALLAQANATDVSAGERYVFVLTGVVDSSGFDSSVNGAAIELGLAVLPNLR
ncbi:MAG: hypothetical protein AAFV32_10000, partial [Myxococcota bacterium]